MKKINAAIIGSGYGYYVIYKAIKRLNNISTIYVYGRSIKKIKSIFKDKKIIFYNSWKKMLVENEINLLAIATIPTLQTEILLSKEIKKKKIDFFFVEKPLAENYEKAKKIFSLYKDKKDFVVDFTFLETDIFKVYLKLIKKKIKLINNVKISWKFKSHYNKYKYTTWKKSKKKGGGIIYFYIIHLLNYLYFFFGNYKIIKVNCINKDKIYFEAMFQKSKKIIIEFDSNFNKKPIHKIQSLGNNLSISMQNNSHEYFKNFRIIVVKYGKKKIYLQKKNKLIKDEDDYRIFPVLNFIRKLFKKERCNNLKEALLTSKNAEKLIRLC